MCDEEFGEVPQVNVLRVLEAWKVGISPDVQNPGAYLLAQGNVVESLPLPDCVSRKMLQYLKRKFGIYIHHFYHPEMMIQAPPVGKPN